MPAPFQWPHSGACNLPGSLAPPDQPCAKCGFPARAHILHPAYVARATYEAPAIVESALWSLEFVAPREALR
jgi:hypothetical protein